MSKVRPPVRIGDYVRFHSRYLNGIAFKPPPFGLMIPLIFPVKCVRVGFTTFVHIMRLSR